MINRVKTFCYVEITHNVNQSVINITKPIVNNSVQGGYCRMIFLKADWSHDIKLNLFR